MKRINSYPKVYALGHRYLGDKLLKGPIIIEEKLDGSQFGFGLIGGELVCRSKRVEIDLDAPGMFAKAVEAVRVVQGKLAPEWIYRGEFLQKPKHNTLSYERVPNGNIIGFDIEVGLSDFLDPYEKFHIFRNIGLETVPMLYSGPGEDMTQDALISFVLGTSILGGQREGIVIKNYNQFGEDGKILTGKMVSDDFKESHEKSWKERNPNRADIVDKIIEKYATKARWIKAVQHLQDDGTLTGTPKDIGPLFKEVATDLMAEEKEAISNILFSHFWKQINRGVTRGLPEWYKDRLMKNMFDEKE